MNKWSYYQLRYFLEYKAKREGVKLVVVKPNYTSKTCSCCHHIGNRNGKLFVCDNCSARFDADYNAAKNIALLGASINMPEKSTMYCNLLRA
jgi:transposase